MYVWFHTTLSFFSWILFFFSFFEKISFFKIAKISNNWHYVKTRFSSICHHDYYIFWLTEVWTVQRHTLSITPCSSNLKFLSFFFSDFVFVRSQNIIVFYECFFSRFQDCHLLFWSMHYRHCWSQKKQQKNERGGVLKKTQQVRYFAVPLTDSDAKFCIFFVSCRNSKTKLKEKGNFWTIYQN